MIQDKVTFTDQKWSSWRLQSAPDKILPPVSNELTVDDDRICDVVNYEGIIGKAKEPFFGSILNTFLRIVSSIMPGDDFKYAYVIDFGPAGRVDLFLSNDTWASTAEIICHGDNEQLLLLANATREYIRYRCFVDGIQPLEK